jgi:protein tyrosine/serine phosphatase
MRTLNWPACYNVRDLGGLPTATGRTTRWRSIIRADILSRLTEEGQQALFDYGVRTVIDLRGPHEVAEWPYTLAGMPAELTYLNLPVEKYYPHVGQLISQAQSRAEVYCITADHYPDCIAAILRAIANAQPGGIVLHCHAGKDRTGVIAALLLSLAGVPAAEIAADYAESQVCLWPLYEQMVAEAGGEDKVGFWTKPTATPEMMVAFLAHLASRYGGVYDYLRSTGLQEEELARVRERLVGRISLPAAQR